MRHIEGIATNQARCTAELSAQPVTECDYTLTVEPASSLAGFWWCVRRIRDNAYVASGWEEKRAVALGRAFEAIDAAVAKANG